MTNEDYVIERLARVGFEVMFDENWEDLSPNSIERALWKNISGAMLLELRKIWQEEKSRRKGTSDG